MDEGDSQPKRKRKSRWEEPEQVDKSIVAVMPKEIVLPGGIKVRHTVTKVLCVLCVDSCMRSVLAEDCVTRTASIA